MRILFLLESVREGRDGFVDEGSVSNSEVICESLHQGHWSVEWERRECEKRFGHCNDTVVYCK